MTGLERTYRRLVRLFPRAWRRHHEDDLVATALDAARPGQRRPSVADTLDLVRGAAVVRLRGLAARRREGRAPDTVPLGAVALLLASIGMLLGVAVTGRVSGQFLVTSLVVTLIPGTGVIYTMSSAVSGGWRRGLPAAVGCTLGIVPHVSAAVLGLSGLMQAGATAFEVVRWLGVAYLVVMAVEMLVRGGSFRLDAHPDGGGSGAGRSWSSIIGRAVALNLLNPKLTVFFFAFLPQFLTSPPRLFDPRLMGLGLVFMAITLAVFLGYAWVCTAVRTRVVERPRVVSAVQRGMGALVLGFAVRLAATDR